jgi:hypothetical protein
MATKTFEVVVRIEIETPDKTEPTEADAYDIIGYALDAARMSQYENAAQLTDVRCDSVVECAPITIES